MRGLAFGLLLLTAHAAAQEKARPARATRADLALALLDFEAALARRPPGPEQVREINQAFDQATLLFFRGSFAEAVQRLRALAEPRLRPEGSEHAWALARGLRLRLEPDVLLAGAPVVCQVLLSPLANPAAEGGIELALRLRAPGGAVLAEKAWPWEGGGRLWRQSLPVPEGGLAPGTYRVELGSPGGPGPAWWPLAVVAVPPESVAREAAALLDGLETADPALIQARELCRSRLELLSEQTAEPRGARLLADLAALSREVALEAKRIAKGADPYAGRTGPWWCALPAGSGRIPLNVYAPPREEEQGPLPLVIALHGAGGDENLFMAGYGAGRIADLAREWGFLVVAPETTAFLLGPLNLDRLLEGLGRLYPIDPQRIYLIGHSMGAMAASGLAASRAQLLAGVCCMAGGVFPGQAGRPPILVIAGGLDPLFPARRMEAAVAQALRAGAEIELRVKPDLGHTLLVGACLPEAVAWLLQRRRR